MAEEYNVTVVDQSWDYHGSDAIMSDTKNDAKPSPESYPLHYSFQLRLSKENIFFGPGVAQLLKLVNETGSLSAAASKMDMAYSKAWKIIKNSERQLGFTLLERQIGGAKGGGSVLTPKCREFVDGFFSLQEDAYKIMDELFNKYFSNFI